MKEIKECLEFAGFTDSQLLAAMLMNDKAHSCIYLRHKSYCIKFMMSRGASESIARDIYQDATIVLYEKIQNPEFTLTSSIQTYLNSICYYQLLARGKSSYNSKTIHTGEFDENLRDWFEENDEITQNKINKILSAFEKLKIEGEKCYERLKLFYFEHLNMDEIAKRLKFKDADTAKNLIGRCRSMLKQMVSI